MDTGSSSKPGADEADTLSARLDARRRELGLPLKRIALTMQLRGFEASYSTVASWFNGARGSRWCPYTLDALLALLQTDLRTILGGTFPATEPVHRAPPGMPRQLPPQQPRVETGPVQFGGDRPGVFIQGDSALSSAMLLRAVISGGPETRFARIGLIPLYDSLRGVAAGSASDELFPEIRVELDAGADHANVDAGSGATPQPE